jgi:hypothetical protein
MPYQLLLCLVLVISYLRIYFVVLCLRSFRAASTVVTERLLFNNFSRPANGFTGRGSSEYKKIFLGFLRKKKKVGKHCARRFNTRFPVEGPTSGTFP